MAGLSSMAPPAAWARVEPAPWGIRLGVATYTFRNFDRAKVIEMIRQLRTPWISVKNTPQQLATDSTREQAREARREFDGAGLKVMSIGNIDMTKAGTVDELRPLFELAKNFGAPMMVCAPTLANLKSVEQLVREYDIRIAIHNHGPEDHHFPSAQSVLDAVSNLDPRCGLCMDVGHAYRAVRTLHLRESAAARTSETTYPDDPMNVIALAGARLLDMHIKDLTDLTNRDSQCDVGDGEIPVPAIFQALKKIGYQGCVDLEYEIHADDPLPGVERSMSYMRGVLAGLAAA